MRVALALAVASLSPSGLSPAPVEVRAGSTAHGRSRLRPGHVEYKTLPAGAFFAYSHDPFAPMYRVNADRTATRLCDGTQAAPHPAGEVVPRTIYT